MKNLLSFSLLFVLFACSKQPNSILNKYSSSDLERIFKSENIKGCFTIYDLRNDAKLSFKEERLDSAFLPASTFKIINSMIALETEVITDENEMIKWDSIDRSYDNWNRDQNLESALKYSTVWAYQELARRIGEERMKYWVEASNYGNKNINGGIDVFWLRGDIRISPNQQIDFLKKLYLNQLPFSQKNQEIVKKIMIVDQTANYTIRAKTGWAVRIDDQIGWYVGYLERAGNVYFFSINIDIKNSNDAAKRKILVSKILDHLQLTK
ncbi:class D beta-lactamase [Labilibaculum antarcticum]|uniref:beta-lactamase n=1 Tax=Labilibaculum antarcticum TaxID=1717717 RepID=A0A1Y1CK89_9BACT|nr:class D beta-lactamase [Labilibaculum antarcticum]BAX80412.1 class D beta-lactamase [Labilibaculum antarcticum]